MLLCIRLSSLAIYCTIYIIHILYYDSTTIVPAALLRIVEVVAIVVVAVNFFSIK
jgi:hypothetical protein